MFKLMPLRQLKFIEATSSIRIAKLIKSMTQGQMFLEPIIVDKSTNIILNGHHRSRSCMRLGLTKIPCILVDYMKRPHITINTQNGAIMIHKDILLTMANSPNVFPFKTVTFVGLNNLMRKVPDRLKYRRIALKDLT